MAKSTSRIFLPTHEHPFRTLAIRALAFIVAVLLISTLLWYVDRDGLKAMNKPDDYELTPIDMVYFTVVTLVTVGYGDIVPVTQKAKLIDTIIITPGRIVVWLLFIGTAYQFIFRQYRERFLMMRNRKNLKKHVIVCGFSPIGRFVVEELIAKGFDKKQIVIISEDEKDCEIAANQGFVTLMGDASREETLKDGMIDKASYIIITTGRDDTNILINLTAKDLNADIKALVRANEEENVKLLHRSGADIIINPDQTGANLIATATERPHSAQVLEDLLSSRFGIDIDERAVTEDEVGHRPKELTGIVVVGVVRNGKLNEVSELDTVKLQPTDIIVFLKSVTPPANDS